MSIFATTCACGRRVPRGERCVCGRGPATEKQRMRAQPWRIAYKHATWPVAKRTRYRLVGGRCEDCGAPLKGDLHPDDGVPWEGDHELEPWRFQDPITANTVENTRCRCLPCHNRKTQASRRARR